MKLPEIGVQRPVATAMFFLAVFVLGAVMLTRLPVDLMPEIEQPTVTVVTTWEGASAEDVESKVTEVVERALGTVSGLAEMTSATSNSFGLPRRSTSLPKNTPQMPASSTISPKLTPMTL